MRPARYKSARGGRGSSKSHTLAQIAVLRMANLLTDWYPARPVRIASARQFQNSITESVKTVVEHYIRVLGLEDEFDIQQYKIGHRNGSHMFFPGFNRHPESLMSAEGVDVLWIEQAETIGTEMEKIIPTIRAIGSELWFSWNPARRAQWCWRRFVARPRSGDVSVLVNYSDNPWFPWELELERRAMEDEDPDRYAHVWLGQPDDGDADKQVLTYGMLQACVEAWRLGLMHESSATVEDTGLDMAEGGADKCAQVIRVGPVVDFIDAWPGIPGDLSRAAERCHENTAGRDIWRLYYDASSAMRREFLALDVDYGIHPINFGGAVMGPEALYETKRKNKDVFARCNIQMADAVRLRAARSVRLVKAHKAGEETDIDPDECLFIRDDLPRLEDYLTDMTQPVRRRNPTTGRWELDKRGGDENAESPDKFDATCLAYCRDIENGLRAR